VANPDARFPLPSTDVRFQTPGVDGRFPSPSNDTRFSGGKDTRFETPSTSPTNTGLPTITPASGALAGNDLVGTVGTWDWKTIAQGTPAFNLKWERDGVPLNFTGLTYPGASVTPGSYQLFVQAVNINGETSPWVASLASVVVNPAVPVIGLVSVNQAANEITISGVTQPGTVYIGIDQNAPAQAGSAIKTGAQGATYAASASVAAAAGGTVTVAVDLSGLVDTNTYYIHATVEDAAGQFATDVPAIFDFVAAAAPAGPALGATTLASALNTNNITVPNPANVAGDVIYYFVCENAANALNLGALPAGITSVATLTSADRITQVLKRTSNGAEAANETFNGGYVDRVAFAAVVSGVTSEVVPVSGSGWGTTLTAASLTALAGSLVFEIFYARSALITRAGSVQSALSGTSGLALSASAGVAAGATAAQTATIGAGQQWGAAQFEVR